VTRNKCKHFSKVLKCVNVFLATSEVRNPIVTLSDQINRNFMAKRSKESNKYVGTRKYYTHTHTHTQIYIILSSNSEKHKKSRSYLPAEIEAA
jgi:hypothetical protein